MVGQSVAAGSYRIQLHTASSKVMLPREESHMGASGLLSAVLLIVITSRLDGQAPRSWPLLPPRPAYADSLPDVARLPIPLDVVAAEAEGRAWVRRAEPCTQPGTNCARTFPD